MEGPLDQSGADSGRGIEDEMAKYGIKRVQISQFRYGKYRYTNLKDAIADAKRHPPEDLPDPQCPGSPSVRSQPAAGVKNALSTRRGSS